MLLINHTYLYVYKVICISFEKSKEISSAKKMRQNFSDGWAFATIFIRAKHAGAVVLKMIFSTSDVSFTIEFALMTPRKQSAHSLGDYGYSTLNSSY